MQKLSNIIEQIQRNKDEMEFLPTGFASLDQHLDGGFLRKELVVLGGGTGKGKSYFAGQILWNIAQKGFKTAYFSLEISNSMVVSRLLGSLANIKPTKLMLGLIDAAELEKKIEAKARLLTREEYMFFYDDIYKLEEIKVEVINNKYEFVVVDFIQNVLSHGSDEYSRLSYIALEFQKLAKKSNSCIFVLSQLSNMVVREGSREGIIEYKGSGNIATVCDLGFFLERTPPFDSSSNFNDLKLNLQKNRRGFSNTYFNFTFQYPGGWITEKNL